MAEVNVDFLEQERIKLWGRITQQEEKLQSLDVNFQEAKKLIESNLTEDERIARGARNKTSQCKNQAEASLEVILETEKSLSKKEDDIESIKITLEKIEDAFKERYNEIESISKTVNDASTLFEAKKEAIESQVEKVDDFLDRSEAQIQKLTTAINNAEALEKKVEESSKNIENYRSNSAKRRDEIRDMHAEIFGNEETDEETGETVKTEGLKDKLDKSYNEIKSKLEQFNKDLDLFKKDKEDQYDKSIENKEDEFELIKEKIQTLLPGAMTAGLSSAFNEKRKQEERNKFVAEIIFCIGIVLLTVIGLIPAFIGVYLFYEKHIEIQNIVKDMPQLVAGITPLYAPIVWLALTSSKKVNQSKRLIEEYAHKEAISKTYEGLSKEVRTLEDEDTLESLKSKLLYNLITINSENPGKLIKGFNEPDHPALELINKTTSLIKSAKSTEELKVICDCVKGFACSFIGNSNDIKMDREIREQHEKLSKLEEDEDEA